MKSKLLFKESGQALVVVALAAVVLFGFMALAIDGTAKMSDRRHAQNAADTAAIAAALAKVNALSDGSKSNTPLTCSSTSGGPYSDVCTDLLLDGLDRAISNGYGDDSTKSTVEIHSPPISGYYAGNNNYVQVIITSHVKTYFMRVLGIQQSDNLVQAVALTKQGGPMFKGASVVSMDPSPACGNGSVKVGGSGTVTLNGGGLFVNSSAGCGYKESNCTNFVINGGGVSSAGSPLGDVTSCHPSMSADTTQAQFVVPDDIYMPDKPSVCSGSPAGSYVKTSKDHYSINAGYYTSFPPVTNSKYVLTLNSGIYCINGDISWNNGTFESLTGSNITIYITSGHSFDMRGGVLNLSATTSSSSSYKGYLIILGGKQSSIQSCKINGGGGGTVTGTIFAPFCNITVNGNSGTDSFSAQVIGYDVTLNGNNTLNLTYDPSKVAQDPRRVGLIK